MRYIFLLLVFIGFSSLQIVHKPAGVPKNKNISLDNWLSDLAVVTPKLKAMTANESAQLARWLYYYVAGPPSTGYPGNYTGPANGLIGVITDILNDPEVRRAFLNRNIQRCANIPTAGRMNVARHALGNLNFNFANGRRRIPNHFASSPNLRFGRRIDIDRDGQQFISLELNCADGDDVISGYMVVESTRRIEVYYQFERNGRRRNIDVYMDFPASIGNNYDEKIVMRFVSLNGRQFKLWSVRTTNDATEGSVGVAVAGDVDSAKAEISVVADNDGTPDDNTAIDGGTKVCVDLATGQTSTGCETVTPPDPGIKGEDFTIVDTVTVPVENVDFLRADTPFYEFESLAIGGSATKTFTLTNVGTAAISGLSASTLAAPFSFSGGSFPGTGGTCASGLAVAATCTMTVTFAPTADGAFSDETVLSYIMGGVSYTTTVEVEGASVDAPTNAVLAISEAEPKDFGPVTLGTLGNTNLTLVNNGTGSASTIAASGLAAPFAFKGGAYPGTGGTCGAQLAAGATCQLSLAFSPTASGVFNDSLEISYNDGATTQAVQTLSFGVTGTGMAVSGLTISETDPYDFGSLAVGATSNHVFVVTNVGMSTVTTLSGAGLAAPFSFTGGSYPGTGGDCGASLAAASSCNIEVTFAPIATGVANDTIDISYNDGSAQTVSRQVTGAGVAPAALAISDGPTYDFGSIGVGSSNSHLFTVTNSGGTTATAINEVGLVAPFAFVGGTYPGTGATCATTLTSGGSCTVNVEFSPTVTGVASDTIDLSYNDGVAAQNSTRNLTGTGVSAAVLTISDGVTYDYGSVIVGANASHTFTVTNTGGVAATGIAEVGLAAPYTFAGGSYPGSGGNCTTTLANGSSCTLEIQFIPVATGVATDTIDLAYNDGMAAQNSTRAVTATGVSPAVLMVSETDPYNFGNLATGATASHTFTITNSGGATATAINESGLSAPFGFLGGVFPGTGGTCTSTLASAGTCDVVVEYAPAVPGLSTDTMSIAYNDGAAVQTSTRDVQGTGVTPALLTISESDPYNYGSVTTGMTLNHTFTVTNSGGTTASGISEVGLAAPFVFNGGAYPGVGGTCGAVLVAAANCTLDIQFAPVVPGLATDTINVNYNNGVSAQSATRNIQGTGI